VTASDPSLWEEQSHRECSPEKDAYGLDKYRCNLATLNRPGQPNQPTTSGGRPPAGAAHGGCDDRLHGLVNRRECRIQVAHEECVIETDDRDVARDGQAERGDRADGAEGLQVRTRDDCRHAALQEGVNDVATNVAAGSGNEDSLHHVSQSIKA